MKLIVDIPDKTYNSIMSMDWKNAGWLFGEELKSIHNAVPIPDNPTEKEIIKIIHKLLPKYQWCGFTYIE